MADEVVIGEEELLRKFDNISKATQGIALVQIVRAGGIVIENAAKINIKNQELMRTRLLSRSIHTESSSESETRAVAVTGTNLDYGPIHEFGGTVRAKTSTYLAIPVGNYKGSPKSHPRLKLRKTAGGNLVMVDRDGTVQYVLKKSVTIPAQPYMRPAFDEHKGEAQNVMQRAFKKAIEKAATE